MRSATGDLMALLLLLIYYTTCLHLVTATRTHREHKVHNIVLYPDKHSWCKTTPIKQVVAWPGCVAREIDNNVCVGACFSYTIPQTEPSAPGDVISPYCDSCQPSEVKWLEVTLECTNEEEQVETLAPEPTTTPQSNESALAANSSTPLLMQKRVQVIANCSCSACHAHGHHHSSAEQAGDSDVHHQPSLLDVPELMGLMRQAQTRKMAGNHSAPSHHQAHPHLPISLPEVTDTEEEEKKDEPATTDAAPIVPLSGAAESLTLPSAAFEPSVALPSAAFEPPVALPDDTPSHAHHVHAHHPHAHHSHHHGHHGHGGAHLEVPQEKLQPAQEGAEMSYHDNLVPSDQSQEKDEE